MLSEKKKTISTHRNFTRNGRRANHRGLLLLNILLFAQGNLGAGKRGSRDREGHSVRFIIRKFVLVSHPQRKEEVKQRQKQKIKLKNGLRKGPPLARKNKKIQKTSDKLPKAALDYIHIRSEDRRRRRK